MRYLITLTLAGLLSGCAAAGSINALPVISEGTPSGTVTVVRPSAFVGGTNSYIVTVGNTEIFRINSGQHTRFTLPAGPQTIGVRCFGGWTPTWKESTTQITVTADSVHILEISPSGTCAEIVPRPSIQADELVTATEYMPLDPS